MKSISKKMRGISKVATGDQHGIFQHFQSNTTDYATRERYLSQRGGEASIGRDTDSLYNLAPEGAESRVSMEYVAPHLSTRYSPDRVGIQAKRISDGVYQDPYTNKIYDYNEGFKTEDGRAFPGGSASLQSSLMRAANILDMKGFSKEADRVDGVLSKVAIATTSEDQPGRVEGPDGDTAGASLGVPSPGPTDFSEIIRALVQAHRNPESAYKLNDARLKTLTEADLTEEEKAIVKEIPSLEAVTNTLASIANALDDRGFNRASDELDLTIRSLAGRRKEGSHLRPIADMASSLDEYGLHYVSDSLDAWLKRNR